MPTPAAPPPEQGVCGCSFDVLHPKCSRQDWRPAGQPLSRAEWDAVRSVPPEPYPLTMLSASL